MKASCQAANTIERCIIISQATTHTGAHLIQPSDPAYEPDNHTYNTSVARRLRLDHPSAKTPHGVTTHCPNKTDSGHVCGQLPDSNMNHSMVCNKGRGIVSRHDAIVRCLADIIQKKAGIPTRVEQWIPTMQRTNANGNVEHARLDVVFVQDGQPTYVDVAVVAPFPGILKN